MSNLGVGKAEMREIEIRHALDPQDKKFEPSILFIITELQGAVERLAETVWIGEDAGYESAPQRAAPGVSGQLSCIEECRERLQSIRDQVVAITNHEHMINARLGVYKEETSDG